MTEFEKLSNEKQEALLKRIRALKAKAEDAGTTEAESLAFAGKVQELLSQYNLELSQLSFEEQEDSPVSHEDYNANWNTSPARRMLAIAVCNLYYVKPLIRTKGPWVLIGRKHNLIMAKEMAAYLIQTTIKISNAWGRATPGGNVVDFRRGCFKRLSERLGELYWEQAKKAAPQYTPQGNPGNLPALYMSEEKLLDNYVTARWKPRAHRARPIKQGYSAMAGRQAGNTISLHRQMGSNGGGNHLLPGPKK
jgi:uncharacterized protein DUF2786